mgnify:CR=1 FL=1
MDDRNENIVMSRFAFERMQSKEERDNLWKNIIILTLIILFAASQAGWIWYINQFEVVDDYSIEAEQDGSGVNIIGGGDVDYGTEDIDKEETDHIAP